MKPSTTVAGVAAGLLVLCGAAAQAATTSIYTTVYRSSCTGQVSYRTDQFGTTYRVVDPPGCPAVVATTAPAATAAAAVIAADAYYDNHHSDVTVYANSASGAVVTGSGAVVTGNGAIVTGSNGGVVAGQSATVHTANGNEVNAARGATYNPYTGQVNRAGAVVGENGGVGHVNGNVYVGHDGEVSQVGGNGNAVSRSGNSVNRSGNTAPPAGQQPTNRLKELGKRTPAGALQERVRNRPALRRGRG